MKENRTLFIGNLAVRIPVIQGGMGVGISLSALAGSVAQCGGVGILSAAQIGLSRARGFPWSFRPLRGVRRSLPLSLP